MSKQELAIVQAELSWIKEVLRAQGVEGPWLSPAKAAPLLGVSRDKILEEIRLAEQLRALKRPRDLEYGVSYRNICAPDAQVPTWQVHLQEFAQFLKIPPDKRKS